MKWTRTSKDLCMIMDNFQFPASSIRQMRTGWYITALMNYAMQKRKLADQTDRLVPTGNEWSGTKSNSFHQHERMSSNVINMKKLKVIQRQLAVLSDEDGDRPIHIAVANEDIKLVQKLCQLMLTNSLHLDITNYMRQTPLHLAVMLGNAAITELLLSLGASPCLSDRNGNTVLHLAVKSNNTDVLRVLLLNERVKEILNSMDYEGYSALHYAVQKSNSSAVKMLHDCGSDMNKIDGKSGRTPLIHAVLEQNESLVDLLLNSGACPHKSDYSGRSALEMAFQVRNMQIISILEKCMPHSDNVFCVKENTESSTQKATKWIKAHD